LRAGFRPSSGVCDFDTTLAPSATCLGADGGFAEDDSPVTCVDWCDASAFCEWAGKRLCAGSYLASTSAPDRGEWFFACSSDGNNIYPYGSSRNDLACNDKDNPATGCGSGSCSTWPAGSSTTCVTPSGVEDMTGNAAEWTGECQSVTGANDHCNAFGGDINLGDAQCGSKTSRARAYAHRLLGFRCCSSEFPTSGGSDI
jgi:formylglycine-generating enzyme required for sulfatase activity